MQNLTFGIEIETIGRTRNAVAKAIHPDSRLKVY